MSPVTSVATNGNALAEHIVGLIIYIFFKNYKTILSEFIFHAAIKLIIKFKIIKKDVAKYIIQLKKLDFYIGRFQVNVSNYDIENDFCFLCPIAFIIRCDFANCKIINIGFTRIVFVRN